MSEFASIIANAGLHQQLPDSQTALKSQNGGKNFQQILENTGQQPQEQTNATAPVSGERTTTGISGAKLDARIEALSNDLIKNVSNLNVTQVPNSPSELLPDLLYPKTRFSLLKQATSEIKTLPQGTELMGRMSQVETEFNQLEAIMKSNKDLSPGELLGLQARLYQVSQHIEVLSKVVDQMTGGIKTVLNTNV
jgi:hypothetical protein